MEIEPMTPEEEEKIIQGQGRWDLTDSLSGFRKQYTEQLFTKDFDIPNTSNNNGGSTDYYKLKPEWKDVMDIIEVRGMNYAQGNMLKVAMTFNVGRHEGTNYERELNKIKFFAERELERIKGNG